MSTRTASDKIENPLQKMENIYIPHPTFTVALERVQRALMMHGAGTSVLGVRITGPAGAGKTTLRRKLREDYPIVCDGYTTGDAYDPKITSDHRPFVDIDMPDQPTVIRLARELISQYTSNKEAKRGGRSILEERVFDYVVGCGTKCIFIDDAQRAVDRNGEVVTDDLSDWLKSLRVKTGVIVVADGRMMVLVLKADRPVPAALVPTPDEKLALYDSMFAYAGTYSVEHDRVVHHIDMSWNKAWEGTDQIRLLKIEGRHLTYTGVPAKNPLDGRDCVHHVEFEKVT